MDLESSIRTRIEALLISDARKQADLKAMASVEEPFEVDPFEEERSLYRRVINSYRSAVGEVNALLEENISFLSSFARIMDNIREKENFQEICSVIVDSLLEDLDVEYCSIMLLENPEAGSDSLYLEGIRDGEKFIFVHPSRHLLGNQEFERAIAASIMQTSDCLNLPDVYKDSRFNGVDFPGVVRSLICVPIESRGRLLGALLMSHSLPQYFKENHIRLVKILSGIISHSKLLADLHSLPAASAEVCARSPCRRDIMSIILCSFERIIPGGSPCPLGKDTIAALRGRLSQALEPSEMLAVYNEGELLLLSPGTPAAALPAKVRALQDGFHQWRERQQENLAKVRMSGGLATCEGTQDIARTLEVASLMMHPDQAR